MDALATKMFAYFAVFILAAFFLAMIAVVLAVFWELLKTIWGYIHD